MNPSRRSFLAAAGSSVAATLAGCSVLGGADPAEVDTAEVEAILAQPVEEYEMPAPVSPDRSAVREGLDRVDELLAAVPEDVGAEAVPNGAIREAIARRRRAATRERRAVEVAGSAYRALLETQGARRDAGEAAGAFRAARGEVTLDGVRAERDRMAGRASAARAGVEYVGDERDRALYVAVRLESIFGDGVRWLNHSIRAVEPSALDVGDLAGRVERGRAALDVGSHLATRHEARLSKGRGFEGAFESALERSVDALDRHPLPSEGDEPADMVGADVEGAPASDVLRHALRELWGGEEALREALADGRLGRGLRRAYALERDARAHERVRERIEEGELRALEGAEPVRCARERAIGGISEAPYDPREPSVPAAMLAVATTNVASVDRQIRRDYLESGSETVPADGLEREYAEYVWTAERLAALPAAVDAVGGRFEP